MPGNAWRFSSGTKEDHVFMLPQLVQLDVDMRVALRMRKCKATNIS